MGCWGKATWRVTVIRMYSINTCMRMSKDTFSDKRLRKHSSVCTNSKIEKKKTVFYWESRGKPDLCCSQPCSERFPFAIVSGEGRLIRSQSAESQSVTGCSAIDDPLSPPMAQWASRKTELNDLEGGRRAKKRCLQDMKSFTDTSIS